MMNAAAMIRMTAPLVRYSQAVLSRLSRLVNWIAVPPQPAPCAHTTMGDPTATTTASTSAVHIATGLAGWWEGLPWVITCLLRCGRGNPRWRPCRGIHNVARADPLTLAGIGAGNEVAVHRPSRCGGTGVPRMRVRRPGGRVGWRDPGAGCGRPGFGGGPERAARETA